MAPPALTDRLVGVSLKMYFDVPQTLAYIAAIQQASFPSHHAKPHRKPASAGDQDGAPASTTLFIVPSTPLLAHPTTQSLLRSPQSQSPLPPVLLGAQNAHPADSGAFTGETSPLQLRELGVSIVEIGHAERRAPPFSESEAFVADKVRGCVRNAMIPLVCVGERDKDGGVRSAIRECEAQVVSTLEAVVNERDEGSLVREREGEGGGSGGGGGEEEYPGVVFAYEPVWAIGAAAPAPAEHVLAVISALRDVVGNRVPRFHGQVRFLYGGSAGPGIWAALKPGCDGLFLGRFAHDIGNLTQVWSEVEAP